MTKSTGRPVGRPTKYSEALADRICEAMINGQDLMSICNSPGFPDRTTVYRWAWSKPDFATRLEKAREALADHAAYEIGQIAANCTPDTAVADRVRLAALQWRASKLGPRKYSDRRVNEVVGAEGGPVAVEQKQPVVIDPRSLTWEERDGLRAACLAALAKAGESEQQD
jgi:hypothetical protein